ncbi:Lactose permease [Fusarium oxysporum f. sp. albedinis]|nr:Lactose permease [Fusarium oxysporum f. sp. albedinis]
MSRKAKQIKTKDKEHAPEPSRPLISINFSLDLASPVFISFSPFSCFWLSLGPLCAPACSQPQPLPSCTRSLCHLRHFRQILVLSITFPYPPLINRHAAHWLICRALLPRLSLFSLRD